MGLLDALLRPILGESSSDKSMRVARQQMSSNERLQQQQLDWNDKHWNEMNSYNSPVQQRARLLEAGINPNFDGSVTMGNATSPADSVSPPYSDAMVQASNAAMSNDAQMFANFSNLFSTMSNAKLANSQANLNRINARTLDSKNRKELAALDAKISLDGSAARFNNEQSQLVHERIGEVAANINQINENVNLIRANTLLAQANRDNVDANTVLTNEQVNAQKLENKWYEPHMRKMLSMMDGQLRNLAADTNMKYEQVKLLAENIVYQRLTNGSAALDFKLKDDTYLFRLDAERGTLSMVSDYAEGQSQAGNSAARMQGERDYKRMSIQKKTGFVAVDQATDYATKITGIVGGIFNSYAHGLPQLTPPFQYNQFGF